MIPPQVGTNQPINLKLFRDILQYIRTRIVAGEGLNVTTHGDQIVLSVKKRFAIGGGSGGGAPTYVAELPAFTTQAGQYREVFWCDEETGLDLLGEAGTGNNQVWETMYPQRRWYPKNKYTANVGIPLTEPEGG